MTDEELEMAYDMQLERSRRMEQIIEEIKKSAQRAESLGKGEEEILNPYEEDKKYGTHNKRIEELKYEKKVYEMCRFSKPIIGRLMYNNTINELEARIELYEKVDNRIRQRKLGK